MKNKQADQHVTLTIRAYPRASRPRIVVADNGDLQVYVTTPAENNKANKAIISALSKVLKTPKSSMEITVGLHSRDKVVKITGLAKAELIQKLDLIK